MTSRLFEFVMRCLATGQNCLPARGIGSVPEQLAAALPPDAIHTGASAATMSFLALGPHALHFCCTSGWQQSIKSWRLRSTQSRGCKAIGRMRRRSVALQASTHYCSPGRSNWPARGLSLRLERKLWWPRRPLQPGRCWATP